MGWFARRKAQSEPEDRASWLAATARRLFAERGFETTIAQDDDDVTLIAVDGRRFFLHNLLAATKDLPLAEAEEMSRSHVDSLVADAGVDDFSRLGADEVRQRIRTRVLSNSNLHPDEPRYDYARPLADGLIVVLCLDLPHTVQTLGDAAVADLGLDIDELYEHGQRNTDLEPVDERDTLPGGVQIFAGGSLFVASKAAHLAAVVDVPPQGVVFSIPHRHLLLAVPLVGPGDIAGVNHLLGVTDSVLRDPAPGGPVSHDLFFAREGRVSRITETDATGARIVVVADDFHQALEELAARSD